MIVDTLPEREGMRALFQYLHEQEVWKHIDSNKHTLQRILKETHFYRYDDINSISLTRCDDDDYLSP